jgi:hypothetical protein
MCFRDRYWRVAFSGGFKSHGLPRYTGRRIATLENPFDRYVAVLLEYFPAESPIYSNWRRVLPKS